MTTTKQPVPLVATAMEQVSNSKKKKVAQGNNISGNGKAWVESSSSLPEDQYTMK